MKLFLGNFFASLFSPFKVHVAQVIMGFLKSEMLPMDDTLLTASVFINASDSRRGRRKYKEAGNIWRVTQGKISDTIDMSFLNPDEGIYIYAFCSGNKSVPVITT